MSRYSFGKSETEEFVSSIFGSKEKAYCLMGELLKSEGYSDSEENVDEAFDAIVENLKIRVRNYATSNLEDMLSDAIADGSLSGMKRNLVCPHCGCSFEDNGIRTIIEYICDVDEDGSFYEADSVDDVRYECASCSCSIDIDDCNLSAR